MKTIFSYLILAVLSMPRLFRHGNPVPNFMSLGSPRGTRVGVKKSAFRPGMTVAGMRGYMKTRQHLLRAQSRARYLQNTATIDAYFKRADEIATRM